MSPPPASRCPGCNHLPASGTVICPLCNHDRRERPASKPHCPYRGKPCDCEHKPYCMTEVA